MLLGLGDWMVALAFYACIASTAAGIIYGIINYNRGDAELSSQGENKHE